jgi:hypothetical protein
MAQDKADWSAEGIKKLLISVLSGDKATANQAMMERFAQMGLDAKTFLVAGEFCQITAGKAPEWSGYHFGAMNCEAVLKVIGENLTKYLDEHGKPD